MPTDREQLLDMGFEEARVDWALRATKNSGLQSAMDHLIGHGDDPIPDPSAQSASSGIGGGGGGGAGDPMDEDDEDAEALRAALGKQGGLAAAAAAASAAAEGADAKSIKCSQCDKIFKNTALANFHAEKSGHDQFEESTEEIKPLTEEEKKAKLEELRTKLAEKRAGKAKVEAEEHKANEAIRRKGGKDIGVLREEMKVKESIKAAEQARKDKLDDAKAKAAIKAQIEADKRERAEKIAREKALREGKAPPPTAASTSTTTTATTSSSAGGEGTQREHKDARLQIRLSGGGQPIVVTLPSESTLQDVAEHVVSQSPAVDPSVVTFTRQFPRKLFARSEFSQSLKDLGLVPSAVLIAS
ncbi:hypothetical protein SCHPADRAFT_911285 [Schizopora paradoxa]|uniref:UBX domain-containing protein n=1 Tax=Schizopora paradoxa TaxID=27342 RepID=A0A0H2QZU9_9AGAM|nr:hypothetical protein SCHPADRAFT_911285 [Schizopora paradoxa]